MLIIAGIIVAAGIIGFIAKYLLIPDSHIITRLIREASALPPAEGKVHLDLRYRGALRPGATMDIYEPLGSFSFNAAPVVVFLHGGSWIHGDKVTIRIIDRFLQRMRSEGYFVAAVNYRSGLLGGFAAPLNNTMSALDWLDKHSERYEFDPASLALYGISAGGQLALMAESRLRSRGVVKFVLAECAPVDLPAMAAGDAFERSSFLGILPSVYLRRHSPVHQVSSDMAPVLIYHGDADEVVHVRQAHLLKNAIDAAGAHSEIEIYPGGTHAFLGMPDSLWFEQETRALRFMRERFGPH